MMFLVRLIDRFVGVVLFIFKGERRSGPSVPLTLGLIGIIALILGLVASIAIPHAWYLWRTSPYVVEFENAAGLSEGDAVYISGVPAGRVEQIALDVDRVRVDLRVDNGRTIGDRSTATVRLQTVLGRRYLEIAPRGQVSTDDPDRNLIPLARTTVPFSLDELGAGTVTTENETDLAAMETMMHTLTEVMPGDPNEVGAALAGIRSASALVSDNAENIDTLLGVSRNLAEIVAEQSDSVASVVADTQTIVQTLTLRREAIVELVDHLEVILAQVSQTFGETSAEVDELVPNMVRVTETLERNIATIDTLMQRMPPSLRAITTATGNGTWTDVHSPSAVIPDNLLCALGVMSPCR